jgi:hypothetical protein
MEKEVFNFVCDFGVRIIKEILESMDKILAEERDKENYRHKGLKKNTIKTVRGPVEYKRAVEQGDGLGLPHFGRQFRYG